MPIELTFKLVVGPWSIFQELVARGCLPFYPVELFQWTNPRERARVCVYESLPSCWQQHQQQLLEQLLNSCVL
jgi:hypothetical protein